MEQEKEPCSNRALTEQYIIYNPASSRATPWSWINQDILLGDLLLQLDGVSVEKIIELDEFERI